MNNANNILGYVYYNIGRQCTNFRICTNYIKKDGFKGFSKWVYYLDSTDNNKSEATHRTLLKNEIVLDYDPFNNETLEELKIRVEEVYNDLIKRKIYFNCFETGSRGYHIHIFINDMLFLEQIQRNEWRNEFINYYKAEAQKNTENVPIALENVPHWKSGKIKKRCVF